MAEWQSGRLTLTPSSPPPSTPSQLQLEGIQAIKPQFNDSTPPVPSMPDGPSTEEGSRAARSLSVGDLSGVDLDLVLTCVERGGEAGGGSLDDWRVKEIHMGTREAVRGVTWRSLTGWEAVV